ncbi:hypothetical protein BJX63DRAFT_409246 [Aspergillus granulosus]|uniref:Uncharacterized protein n=1 Tax=Aspergillus granulosus TaxID=176169 RepID=A0ABR4GZ53_9EURO
MWGLPVLDSIQFPDLESLGGLDVYQVNDLQNFTFPKLRQVDGKIDITSIETDSNVDFGLLEHAGALRLHGQFKDIKISSLQTVDNDLVIESCEGCKAKDSHMQVPDNVPVIDLSSLVSVGYIKIAGVISGVSMPDLASIGPPASPGNANLSTDSGARFYFNETSDSFDFNLTHLEEVDKQFVIYGNIDSLHMEALRTINASIYIDAGRALDIDLPLESASSITLTGRITSVHLPNVSSDTPITLDSDYSCKDHSSLTEVSCPVPSKLTKAEKIGMGIGIAVGVALIILGVFFCCKLSRKQRAERQRTELADLPAYGVADSSTVLRPRTPPPPYSATGQT